MTPNKPGVSPYETNDSFTESNRFAEDNDKSAMHTVYTTIIVITRIFQPRNSPAALSPGNVPLSAVPVDDDHVDGSYQDKAVLI